MSGVTDQPEILTVRISPTTNAVVNTVQQDVILAAGGAGTRYRIYGVQIHFVAPNATGNLTGRLLSGATDFAQMAITAGQQMADGWVFPMGIPCPANTGVNLVEACSVASVNYRVSFEYTLEPV